MKQNNFFASCAKAAFALAAVVMMSAVFTSCSKDSDDDDEKKFTNTVIFGNMEKPIVKAEYEDQKAGDYRLYLYLSADRKKRVQIELNKDLHITGSPVKLTEKEKKHTGKWYWVVEYDKPDGTILIDTWGNPGEDDYPVFTTGTLTISGSPGEHHQHQTRKRTRKGQRRQGAHPYHQLQWPDDGDEVITPINN